MSSVNAAAPSLLTEQEVRTLYRELTTTLIGKKMTITTMESATSGQIASLITDTEGSSAIFKGAYISYSNEVKIQLGVPASVIDTYTVYSEETAAAMAETCAKAFHADIGIGVTGTTGNVDSENASASVPGCVYFAIRFAGRTETFRIQIPPQPTRLAYKLAAAGAIGKELLSLIG